MLSRSLQTAVLDICFLAAGCGGSAARATSHRAQAKSPAATAGLNVCQLGYLYTVAPNGALRLFIRNMFGSDWSPDGTRERPIVEIPLTTIEIDGGTLLEGARKGVDLFPPAVE